MIQLPQFGVYEDGIMLAMGFYALGMLVVNWQTGATSRRQRKQVQRV
jgi:hypothetical protein